MKQAVLTSKSELNQIKCTYIRIIELNSTLKLLSSLKQNVRTLKLLRPMK